MKWKSREVIKCKPHLWFAWKPVRCTDVDTPEPEHPEWGEEKVADTMVWFSLVYRKCGSIEYDWEYFTVAEWVRRQLTPEKAKT